MQSVKSEKFEESVDIAIRLGVDPNKSDQNVRGAVTLPNSLGKAVTVAVFADGDQADAAKAAGAEHIGMDDLAEKFSKEEISVDVVISTNGGLWRYLIGDTVKFTSLSPYKVKITGRTKHHINVFGEELIIENAEEALKLACKKTKSTITDYTVGPIFMNGKKQGSHEWVIEFAKAPQNLKYFTELLDNALKSINSDYEAKRYNNMTLVMPKVHSVKKGLFYTWLKKKGKLGGQHKVPRLSNKRDFVEELLRL